MTTEAARIAELTELLQHGYRYALSLTHHKTRAEDLLQDAWLAVLQARGTRTRSYLFSAIRTRFLNLYKRERLVPMIPLEDPHVEMDMDDELRDIGPLFRVEEQVLEAALASLRPVEREALFLAAVQDYTAQEIADLTQQTRGTVLSLIHRARHKLRRMLPQRDERKESGL